MSLSNKYDSNIYVEPDGSSWVRIFHHNNPASSGMFANHSDSEWAAGVYANENKWFDTIPMINSITSPYEFMVKQKNTSSDAEFKVRWIQSYNPITTTDWNTAKPGTVTFITTSGYISSSMGGLYRNNTYSYFLIANASNGNSWGRVGSKSVYQGGIPGYPNNLCTTGYMDLYVRVDSLTTTSTVNCPAIWLPLNGNLNNQGFAEVSAQVNGATVNSAGKIGQCYSFDGSDDFISLGGKCLYDIIKGGSQPFSVTMWIYRADATRGVLFGDYSLPGTTGTNILELRTDHKLRFYWKEGTGPDKVFNGPVTASAWNHIALTYDGSKVVYYLNGVQQDTYSGTLATITKTTGLYYLGRDNRTGTTAFNGKMNDFRLYNYALSAKEVKEISKALVLHYKLDDEYIEATTNYLPQPTSYSASTVTGWDASLHPGAVNVANWSTGYNGGVPDPSVGYHAYWRVIDNIPTMVFRNENSVNNHKGRWMGISVGVPGLATSLPVGTKYTISLDVMTIENWGTTTMSVFGGVYFKLTSSGSYGFHDGYKYFSNTRVGVWERFSATWTRSSSYDGNNVSPSFYMYGGSSNEGCMLVRNLQIEIKDHATGYTLYSHGVGTCFDSSGFGYNGTITGGSLGVIADTPRYNASTSFPSTVYIDRVSPSAEVRTVSFWAKWNSIPSGQSVIYVDYKSKTGCGLMSTGILCKSTNGNSPTFSKSGIVANTWYHFVIVCPDGTASVTRQLYINGVAQSPTSNTSTWTYDIDELQIGKRSTTSDGFNGNLSDFRMYGKAFTAEEALELYQTSASIDKDGNYYARELVE